MAVPLLDLRLQHEPMAEQLGCELQRLIASGRFILGPYVEKFERQLAACCAVGHAVGVSSGTDALLVALMASGVAPGDEVITTPFTFFATAGAIVRLGARPVFVDIDPSTLNISPSGVARAVSATTKAIVPVHLYGQTADMTPLMRIATQRGLVVIEDAAQAIGATYGDKPAGALGHIGCFSFYPSKNLGAMGDGGACTLNDAELARRIAVLRDHGQAPTYHYNLVGGNFRLDAVQALILSMKLPRLSTWIDQRRAAARRYCDLLADVPVELPVEADGGRHAYNQFTIRVGDGQRDELRRRLNERNIGSQVYYPVPLHLQPCLEYLGYQQGDFPVAEQAAGEVLSLPMYPELTESQQREVSAAIGEFFA